ncbi:MAG: hypothetical protein LBU06_03150 [Desulfovibrio sp.]|jgi:hypothetical protein|nr:hypothetical protein [Desulfovibrio sp.]
MSSVSSISGITSSIDLGSTGSLQFQFAKLQLALAEASKNGAMDYIKQIEDSQAEQKKVSDMLQKARQLKADAAAKGDKEVTEMSVEMETYMKQNGLAIDQTGGDRLHNKDEWDVAITSLQSHLDKIGSNTQQLMVFVQDYMGQYNSYLQGGNSAIQQGNQTLAELAKVR